MYFLFIRSLNDLTDFNPRGGKFVRREDAGGKGYKGKPAAGGKVTVGLLVCQRGAKKFQKTQGATLCFLAKAIRHTLCAPVAPAASVPHHQLMWNFGAQ